MKSKIIIKFSLSLVFMLVGMIYSPYSLATEAVTAPAEEAVNQPAGQADDNTPAAAAADEPADNPNEETDPMVLKKLNLWQDLKFGLFIHWGAYSVWGSVESWPLVDASPFGRDVLPAWQQSGKDPNIFNAMYFALNRQFNPKHFNPGSWAAAARRAGMKYIVFTTKHCDGFCMFDTRQTVYRVTDESCPFSGNPQANVTRAVFDAFRDAGFYIGAYYAKADWHHPDYWCPDWPHPQRQANYDTGKYPNKWTRYQDFVHKQVEELMTGYGPIDILWLDCNWVSAPKEDIDISKLAVMARRHQPGLIIVDRMVGGRYENYRTPEQKIPPEALLQPWETCMTMGDQWSYKSNDNYKSARQLIFMLVNIVARGGNFLLDIGPDADGQLPDAALQRLQEIGDWLKINGQALYYTRPIAPYNEANIYFTQRDNKVYAIYLDEEGWSAPPERINIASIHHCRKARLLGSSQALKWSSNDATGLTLELPQAMVQSPPCKYGWAFEITVE